MQRVRIIKRDERSRRQAVQQAEVSENNKVATANPERELAAVVMQWVGELRRKQRAELQRSYDVLTAALPAPASQ